MHWHAEQRIRQATGYNVAAPPSSVLPGCAARDRPSTLSQLNLGIGWLASGGWRQSAAMPQ